MIINQRQVRNFHADTVAEAELLHGRPGLLTYIAERSTMYEYKNPYPVTINGYSVIRTADNGFSRLVAVKGKYARSFAKFVMPDDEFGEVFENEQLIIWDVGFKMGENSELHLHEGAQLTMI